MSAQALAAGPDEAAAPATTSATEKILLLAAGSAATPMYLNVLGHKTLRSTDLLVAIACVTWALRKLKQEAAPLRRTPIDLPFVSLLAALLFSSAMADDLVLWAKALRPWLLFTAAFYLLAWEVRSVAAARRLALVPLVGMGVQAIFGIIEIGLGNANIRTVLASPFGRIFYEPDVLSDRLKDFYFNWAMPAKDPLHAIGMHAYPSGTTINSTIFSIVMAMLAMSLAVVKSPEKKVERATLAGAVVVAVLAFLSFKRSGWIACLVDLPLLGLLGGTRAFKRGAVVIAAVLVVFLAMRIVHPAIAENFSSRATSVSTELSERGTGQPNSRILLWKNALRLFRQHPLSGIGAGQWEKYAPWTPTRRGLIQWGNPESSMAGVAAETGIFGILGLVGIFATLLWTSLRLTRRAWEGANTAALAGIAIAAITVGTCLNDALTDDKVWPLFATYAAVLAVLARHRPARVQA